MATPYRCPVCNGKGIVPNGFYNSTEDSWATTSIAPETCKSCWGTGIVWDYDYKIDWPTYLPVIPPNTWNWDLQNTTHT
jgi:hypothetical protein